MKSLIKYSRGGKMQASIDNLVKNLFSKNSLREVEVSELENYIQRFPYAAVGHLLLSRKKLISEQDFVNEASRSAFFVPNPLWVHSFLQEKVEEEVATVAPLKNTGVSAAVVEQDPEPEVAVVEHIETNNLPHNHSEPLVSEQEETELEESPITEITSGSIEEPALPGLKSVLESVHSEPVKDDLSFEPYHTIDYFASQGIKLKAEDLTKDKFGRQLKSFTEWLRTMKRVGPATAGIEAVPAIDEAIQKKAEESVENNEVETEAMAEVWLKQGKTAKAIEIYRKLSLLNPSKSHYFAAKIDQLNAL